MEELAADRKIGRHPLRDIGLTDITKGAQVTAIIVRARMRPLLRPGHEERSWSDVVSRTGPDGTFSFEHLVDRHVYCLEPSRSQVVVYEPQRREVVYQLDHVIDNKQLMSQIGGFQCLELGAHCMLLVERQKGEMTANDSRGSYKRVGISIGSIRPDFLTMRL